MIDRKPALKATDGEWHQYADDSGTHLISKLMPFLSENFSYTERYVKQHLNLGLGATVNAFTLKYDLYFRLFPRPEAGWPRETLVIARIGFKQPRAGHGRKILTMLAGLAPEIGYQHIGIESTNDQSRAFGKRFGLQPIDERGRNWIGSVGDVQRALA